MSYIDIRDLTFSYPDQTRKTLDHIDLQIEQGEYVLLCGVSGSGKTTLLRHFKPVLTPFGESSGSLTLRGCAIASLPPAAQASRIGYVMQNPDEQLVTDQVWHELAFGLENLGCDPKVMRIRVAEMASYFGIQQWFHREVRDLSGGQKQLLNLASIMAMQPEVLILDEPTSQLDPIAAADFLNTIRQINRELGTTILLTEHRMEDIFPVADRVVVMDEGRIIANDRPERVGRQLLQQKHPLFDGLPAPMQVYYRLGGTDSAPLHVREGRVWLSQTLAKQNADSSDLSTNENASSWDLDLTGPSSLKDHREVLRIRNAWFRYKKNSPDILKDLNLRIPEGIIFALVGGNGTGKSTLLKMICGLNRPYRGHIEILGKDIRKYRTGELFSNGLSMLPQDPMSLFVKKTVREDLEEMTADPEMIREVLRICEIEALQSANPRDLSGGELQRAALAKVLLTSPRILLLDEPTKGMDCRYKQHFARLLRSLQKRGITSILVSHDLEFCAEYVDLVGMCFDGQILATNTPRRFFSTNSFYTTVANRMSRHLLEQAVTVSDVVSQLDLPRSQ
ncbi:MAG: ATP-binding cassette domain-containing protein [Lachnospiraceae bacterium]|nr:ATP-binding cassette domain-containing protein [Lachnospiraceae bacterium]